MLWWCTTGDGEKHATNAHLSKASDEQVNGSTIEASEELDHSRPLGHSIERVERATDVEFSLFSWGKLLLVGAAATRSVVAISILLLAVDAQQRGDDSIDTSVAFRLLEFFELSFGCFADPDVCGHE